MKKVSKIYTWLIMAFLYLPIFVLILYSFNDKNSTSVMGGFSLRWYRELFSDSATMSALKNTLLLAVLSSLIATVLGTLCAYGIYKMKSKALRGAVNSVVNIPIMNPEIVTGISMMLLFVFVGALLKSQTTLGFGTILIAHTTFNLPYVYLSVLPKFKQMDVNLPEAALDLGCTPIQSFFKVELPAIMSGIVTGLIMAFTLSLDDFVISYFTIGSGFETLPIRIYSMTKKRVTPDMYALSALIFASILILLIISNMVKEKDKKQLSKNQKKALKIVVSSLFGAILVVTAVVLIASAKTEVRTVNVYNWGEYISDGSEGSYDTNAEFELYMEQKILEEEGKTVDVRVNYTTYASNEDLYAKLKSGVGGYDVIIPSDYMIQKLSSEGLIESLDLSLIPNYQNIKEALRTPFAVTGESDKVYYAMYTYGIVGIIYNTEVVDEEDVGGWDLLWNEKYAGQILQFNNPRDGFGTAMYKNGINVNTRSEDEWRSALEELKKQKPLVQSYVMDEIYNKMESKEAAIAAYYAGDCLSMIDNTTEYDEDDNVIGESHLAFYYPTDEDGNYITNIFCDAMCIPKGAQNYDLACEYINFMLGEEAGVANAEYIYYGCPNEVVLESEEYQEELGDDYDIIYDDYFEDNFTQMFATYAYEDLPSDLLALENKLWEELKVDSSSFDGTVYIVCGVIALAIVGGFVFLAVRKCKRRKFYWNQSK